MRLPVDGDSCIATTLRNLLEDEGHVQGLMLQHGHIHFGALSSMEPVQLIPDLAGLLGQFVQVLPKPAKHHKLRKDRSRSPSTRQASVMSTDCHNAAPDLREKYQGVSKVHTFMWNICRICI